MLADSLEKSLIFALTETEGVGIETCVHSRFSWLFFSKDRVYKVRRDQPAAVTALAGPALQSLTEREFERGKRFTTRLYQGLTSIQVDGKSYKVLILKRLQDHTLLLNIYRTQAFGPRPYANLVDGLNSLHQKSSAVRTRSVATDTELTCKFLNRTSMSIKTPIDSTFDLGKCATGLWKVFGEHMAFLQERVARGFVIDTHGDLHSANIFLVNDACFIDPAVASSHMYQLDYLNQMADVILDLAVSGCGSFVSQLMRDVAFAEADTDSDYCLSRFYLPLRALLRVALWRLYWSYGLRSPLASSVERYCDFASGCSTLG
jgi:aminoglycoside phosphotransferase family enzyme